MLDFLTNIPTLLGILAGIFALFWGNGKLQRRAGRKEERQEISDQMDAAYNDATKEVRDAQSDLPDDPVAVLERLHEFAKRGKRDGNS